MRFYSAPMEGVTGWLYRGVHHRCFPGADKYFMPFLSVSQDHVFPRRELQDILPAHNEGVPAVPQLLTRRAEDFLWAAGELAAMGYREVNLNLGCPSGTVTAKGKGSGFLAFPEELDRFLEEIFSRAPVAVSVKTRLGVREPEEFLRILEIYNALRPFRSSFAELQAIADELEHTWHATVNARFVRESAEVYQQRNKLRKGSQ